jgi:hypothetical protein
MICLESSSESESEYFFKKSILTSVLPIIIPGLCIDSYLFPGSNKEQKISVQWIRGPNFGLESDPALPKKLMKTKKKKCQKKAEKGIVCFKNMGEIY